MDNKGSCELCDNFDSERPKWFSTPVLTDNDVKCSWLRK